MSPQLNLRTAKNKQRAVRFHTQTVQTHSSQIERRAARRGGGTAVGERRPASAGGMGEAGSALEMRRLEAPVRNKPGIDQHQRRTLRTDLCDMGSDTRKCSAAGRLCVTERRLNRSAGDRRRERAVEPAEQSESRRLRNPCSD